VLVRLPHPTWRRGLTSVTLRPGVIDEDAREVFAWGYCHTLAGALHQVTGWPLVVLCKRFGGPGRQRWHWIHAGVNPGRPGLLLDVAGVRALPEAEADYAPYGGPFRWALPGNHPSFCRAIGLPDGAPGTWWRQDLAPAAAVAVLGIAAHLAGQVAWDAGRRAQPPGIPGRSRGRRPYPYDNCP